MASCPCSLQLWTVIAPAGLCVKPCFWAEGGVKQKQQLARWDGQPVPCWHALVGRWKTENVGKKLTGQTEGEGVRHSVPTKPQSLQKVPRQETSELQRTFHKVLASETQRAQGQTFLSLFETSYHIVLDIYMSELWRSYIIYAPTDMI